nr:hypothetical protein CFP56_19835 [Quercus suber]
MDDIVAKRGEAMVVAIEEVSSGVVNKDKVATKDEAELKGKEKEWVEEEVEDQNLRKVGEGGRGGPNGEAEDPNEKKETVAVGGFEKEKGEGVDCEEEKEVEMEHSNVKPNMVTHSLTLVLGK